MTTNTPDNSDSTPEHHVATPDDVQLRELFSSLPVSSLAADFDQRVLTRVHRRKITIRATWAVSLIVLLSAGWYFRDGYPSNVGGDSLQPSHVVGIQPAGDSDQATLELTDEVERFLIAYQGISSPVLELETLENQSQALLNYLSSLEASMEIQ